jgi:hypothetical protein
MADLTCPGCREAAYALIDEERARQAAKWAGPHAWGSGDCSSPTVPDPIKLAVLLEEVGEVSRALLDNDPDNLATELIQVAAVAVAWLEGITS